MATPHERTTVLFGGDSSEHRVSVASAQYLAQSLAKAHFWFWNRDGIIQEIPVIELSSHQKPFEVDFRPSSSSSWPNIETAVRNAAGSVVFLALHGGSGEDGTMQGLLQERGIDFTGSSYSASRLSFDKQRSKLAVAAAGATVARGSVVHTGQNPEDTILELLERLGPLVVKPLSDGSSSGLRFLHSREEVLEFIREAEPEREFLAEETIEGTELTVGVVERPDRSLEALPCSEIAVSAGNSFDFDGKYLGKGTTEYTPARISEAASRAAQELAVLSHRELGCYGYTRTDMILRGEEMVYLETNTLPGLTEASFIPQQLREAGIPMEEFVSNQLYLATHRAGLEGRSQPK